MIAITPSRWMTSAELQTVNGTQHHDLLVAFSMFAVNLPQASVESLSAIPATHSTFPASTISSTGSVMAGR